MALSSFAILGLGAVGGLLNAVIADDARLGPTRLGSGSWWPLARAGLCLNLAFGALAALVVARALSPRGSANDGLTQGASVLQMVACIGLGLLAARWMTNENDKHLLRAAASKACAAPAAHPDTVRIFEVAPPFEVHRAAEQLMPRHRL